MPQTSDSPARAMSPANRIGVDYRSVPARKLDGPIVDFHCHVRNAASARLFFTAGSLYGVTKVLSMSPLENVDALRDEFAGRIDFIAVPNWKSMAATAEFRDEWMRDLASFRQRGARLCKFWMAPPMRGRYGLTLEHDFLQPVIARAQELGFEFMVHIGDPSVWWRAGGKYADTAKFGTKRDQYAQLEYFLRLVAPRHVVGAHLGGSIEDVPFLQELLDRYPNYWLDTSATKWIVREVARQPAAVREFIIHYHDRILFGSDLVTEEKHDFEHYASRYWCHQMMWETGYRGESPIEDPDAPNPPQLAGVDLPPAVLRNLYFANAERLLPGLLG
jgi:hypothetical protein